MTRDDLIKQIAFAISKREGIDAGEASDFADWHWEESIDAANAALSAIETAGFRLVCVTAEEGKQTPLEIVEDAANSIREALGALLEVKDVLRVAPLKKVET